MGRKISHGMLLQQPWARLVAEGVFPALVRSMPTEIRGPVAIAARGYDLLALIDGRLPNQKEFPQTAIIGSVEISDCDKISHGSIRAELRRKFGPEAAGKVTPAPTRESVEAEFARRMARNASSRSEFGPSAIFDSLMRFLPT